MKVLSIFFLFAVVFTNAELSGTCGKTCNWIFNDGVLTIKGTGEMESYTDSDFIPWGDFKSKITSVIVEHGITYICDYAFSSCRNLKTVTLPETLKTIGMKAIYSCEQLKYVTFLGKEQPSCDYKMDIPVVVPKDYQQLQFCGKEVTKE